MLWTLDKLDDKHFKKVAAVPAAEGQAKGELLRVVAADECGCEGAVLP